MSSKKFLKTNKKTLKNKINKYIFKKKDICCENEIDRKLAIQDIFKLYEENSSYIDEYGFLSDINNDIVKFIGYKSDLDTKYNMEGLKLWELISAKTEIYVNNKLDSKQLIDFLNQDPLYYLLSFLGYSYYRYKRDKDSKDIIRDKKKQELKM